MLEIPAKQFSARNLARPLHLGRRFDLVLSLEVAEHLPAAHAARFVASLVALGPVVLFSAAIPFQGGTNHVNEQWPEYWVERFARHGYTVIDCLRRRLWRNADIEWWYAQNLLLFAERRYAKRHTTLRPALERTAVEQLAVVHPGRYLELIQWNRRLDLLRADLAAAIPEGEPFILVDEDQMRGVLGRRSLPFLERDGQYWGLPSCDEAAIAELERLRSAGARFVAFSWPAFWWLEHYAAFDHYVRAMYRTVIANDRVLVFDLRPDRRSRVPANRRQPRGVPRNPGSFVNRVPGDPVQQGRSNVRGAECLLM